MSVLSAAKRRVAVAYPFCQLPRIVILSSNAYRATSVHRNIGHASSDQLTMHLPTGKASLF